MQSGLIYVIFLFIFAFVLLMVSLGMKFLESERKKRVSGALRTASRVEDLPEASVISSDADEEGQGPLFAESALFKKLNAHIQQAGMDWTAGRLLFMMVVGAILGGLLGTRVIVPVFREFAMAIFAVLFGAIPLLWVMWKRKKRLGAFEEQFPEALDFLSRSLRAGHAFSVSLEMMADESPDPLGVEFRKVFHEQNLGASIDVALQGLALRVPLLDVRFFVSAVLLQRETGGNLAEILTKLAYVIRERFRLKGQVRAVSAHGRITATVLSAMPVVTMLGLLLLAPGYLQSMAADEDGKYLIVGSIVGQIVGYYWMKKIIDIKV